MSAKVVNVKRKPLADCLTCPLCNKLFKKATSIMECLHTFCKKCIHKKLEDEELDYCPVCKIDLGASPLEKLRPDFLKENLRLKIFGSKPKKAQPVAEEAVPFAERQDSNPDPELVQPSTGRVEMENQPTITMESNAATSSGSVNQARDSEKKSAIENVGSSSAKSKPIWFSLTSAQVGESPLPQIPSPYIKIEDGSVKVSTLKKYVARKLGLAKEAEVEISLGGYPMDSMAQLKDLLEWWLNNSPEHSRRIQIRVGSSGKDFVMPLTYGWKLG